MPSSKRTGAGSAAPQALSDVVSISRQFLRSVRIDTDFGREDALSGYVCQGSARSVLESMAKQILETKQRAFTWTGPYGGGKSSLALMLCSLLGPSAKLRARAKEILDLPSDSIVHRAFHARTDGWVVLPIVGKRASVIAEISRALAAAAPRGPGRRPKNTDAVSELVSAAERHPQGVLVVIDEMGKFLEASAQEGGDDIYFFQELAEAASRTNGKLVVVGILHQAFEAYATRLGRQARDDWAKVQGRFVDIPLVAATDEVVELIGRAIVTDQKAVDRRPSLPLVEKVASAIRSRRPGTPPGIVQSLARCWPLHPVTAALLGPISKRRFGQNERSTFGFLASREPLGFMEYLAGAEIDWTSMYGPAQYWDYLRANLEPAILASPDSHRWAVAVDAVERAEAKGLPLHVSLTKTVALIEMFRNGSGLVADLSVLATSIRGGFEPEVSAALGELVTWKILIERKHIGAYGVYAGSDFDIEGAIYQARTEIGTPDIGKVSALADLQPILAKRLYQETGTMRWFTRRIVRMEEAHHLIERFKIDKGSVGSFVLCLPGLYQTPQPAEILAKRISQELGDAPILLGVPANALRISELSQDLLAAERVLNSRPELEGDPVARRELSSRIATVKASLEEELADAFNVSRWYYKGKVASGPSVSLASLAADIAGEIFSRSPIINSELINREDLSSNVKKARKELMYRMVSHGHLDNLGYEGFPADAGLWHTTLKPAGLHNEAADGRFAFTAPGSGPRGMSLASLWYGTEQWISEGDAEVSLPDLYERWASPPYGLRAGVMPVLALAFFLAHRSKLALYVGGTFTPDISESVIDEWLLDPARIRFQFVAASKDQAKLLRAIATTVVGNSEVQVGTAVEPLDAARGLVALVIGLPGWSKRTTTVSQTAQDVRAMLLKANDPHKVLFADLPTLLGTKKADELVARLKTITADLSSAYGSMLEHVRRGLLDALDHGDRDLAALRERAAAVKGITGDFRLDAFAGRLEVFDGSAEGIEGLISLAVSKPSNQWVDRDVDAALMQLGTWGVELRRAETMAHLRGRPSTRRVIGVVFGGSHGLDASGQVDVAAADAPEVDRLVKELLVQIHHERPDIVLAALAEAGARLVNQRRKETS